MENSENFTKLLTCGLCNHMVKESHKSDLIEHFKSAHKIVNESEKLSSSGSSEYPNSTASLIAEDNFSSKVSAAEASLGDTAIAGALSEKEKSILRPAEENDKHERGPIATIFAQDDSEDEVMELRDAAPSKSIGKTLIIQNRTINLLN